MTFENDKKVALSKDDKSKKGGIDDSIKRLCEIINSSPDYYTTSSCAGRIVLLVQPESGKKQDAEWLLSSHETVNADQVIFLLRAAVAENLEEDVWLKEEGMILHIRCKDMASAQKMLAAVRGSGLKRSGLISLGTKLVIETLAIEKVEALMMRAGKIVAPEEYIKILVDESNKKLAQTHEQIKKLERSISSLSAADPRD